MTDEMAKQLDIWWEIDEHQKIVDAVMAVPASERDYDMLGSLAVAYNNLSLYDDAIAVLMDTKEQGRLHYKWYYRLGYALYYLYRFNEALDAFTTALELYTRDNPEQDEVVHDYMQWIGWCEEDIANTAKPVLQISEDNHVSVWVGKCDTEEQFIGYICTEYDDGVFSSRLADDFGIAFYDEDFSLVNFCDTQTSDLETLLDTGAPDYVIRHFSDKFGRYLDKQYNCCIMLFDIDCNGTVTEKINPQFGEFIFLGNTAADKTDVL